MAPELGQLLGLPHASPALHSHCQAQWTSPDHRRLLPCWAGQERQQRWGFWIFTAGSRFGGEWGDSSQGYDRAAPGAAQRERGEE